MIPKVLVSTDLQARVEKIKKFLFQTNITNPHADLLYFEAGTKLGIEQTRKIKEHLSFKPIQAKGKIVVLEDASSLTTEAQNALLKMLEEPPPDALIVLGANSEADLLPTVISRCNVVVLDGAGPTTYSNPIPTHSDIKKLLESDIPTRLEYIENLEDKKEFLRSLISFFRQQLFNHQSFQPLRLNQFLKELLQAEEWANQNVNIRAILEYLMLKMPQAGFKI